MRLTEIESSIACGNVTEESLEQFKTALNRSPRAYRCEHCYTTAVSLDERYFEQAMDLICYGLQFCDNWSDRMRAYYSMGIVYEKHKDYNNALQGYQRGLHAVPDEERATYLPDFSAHMMRMELHRNGFTYSENLRDYYAQAVQGSPFSRAFVRRAFYEALAEIVLFCQDGNTTEMRKSYARARDMLSPDYRGTHAALLQSKMYNETLEATEEVLTFLKEMGKII